MDKPTGAGAAAGARGRSLRSRRPPPGTAVAEWHIWRGSPELLAHVMRVAERATGGPTKTAIDIAVQDDHEIFSTPQEFLDGVTLEALRNFKSISAVSAGPEMTIEIRLEWKKGLDPDAKVTVTASGVDTDKERIAIRKVHNAIKRGGTDRVRHRQMVKISAVVAGAVISTLAFGALLFLLSGPLAPVLSASPAEPLTHLGPPFEEVPEVVWGGLLGVVVPIFGGWLGNSLYPSLEIAERGEMRWWRVGRPLGGLAAGLVVAAIGKVALGA